MLLETDPLSPSPACESSNISLGHGVVIGPLLDVVEVAAHVVALVVWPVALLAGLLVEGEDVDVGQTHEVHAQDLDAVVWVGC